MDSLEKYLPWFGFLGFTIGILMILGYYKDEFREWKHWQREYLEQEINHASSAEEMERARSLAVEIRQIVPPGLDRVDRCISCHLAVEDPVYAGNLQPLAYHPNHAQHPFEKFGCTVCHQGQGRATDREAAHGRVKHWERPMLSMKYIQAACAKCHSSADIRGAAMLTRGSELFEEQGCIGCHKLGGFGSAIGPELDRTGATRSPEWLAEHFKIPRKVVSGSGMPPVRLGEQDIEALTLFMLGQTGEQLSEYFVSMKILPAADVGQRIFNQKGCIGCHSIGGTGGNVGPDLADVSSRRTTDWIDNHFRDPAAESPGTVMPKFNFSESEIRALTSFLVSLGETDIGGYWRDNSEATPEVRGRSVYLKYGCGGCHGPDGRGGVPNPNAASDEQIPPLMTEPDLADIFIESFIIEGVTDIAKLDQNGPKPPLYMPAWGDKISEAEMADLISYLRTLETE